MFMTYDMTCVYTSIMLHEKFMPDSAQSLPKEMQLHIFYLILNNRASLHQFHTLWGEKKALMSASKCTSNLSHSGLSSVGVIQEIIFIYAI